MEKNRKLEVKVIISFLMTTCLAGTIVGCRSLSAEEIHSKDGKYSAQKVKDEKGGIHFQVIEVDGGRVVITTHAEYTSPNDVKAGKFSTDSTKFAAAYHYGHAGNYTWVGVWDLNTGKFVRSVRLSGWVNIIPNSVFEDSEKS
jgi:hypothetical protein